MASIWDEQNAHRKKVRQGMGRGTKWGTKNSKRHYKKRYRGQGKKR